MLKICHGKLWLRKYIIPEGTMSTEIVGQTRLMAWAGFDIFARLPQNIEAILAQFRM